MKEMNQIQVELQAIYGTDRDVANAAWTSSMTLQGKEKRTDVDVERVVKMLIHDRHSVPVESIIFKFWYRWPIKTDRQHMTHRMASHNGMSSRYRTMPEEWHHCPSSVRSILERTEEINFINEYEHSCKRANIQYRELLNHLKECEKLQLITNEEYKRVREWAVGILPLNNLTERVSIFNLRSFANYQKLRNSIHAQEEIRLAAQMMLQEVEEANVCPVVINALKEIQWEI